MVAILDRTLSTTQRMRRLIDDLTRNLPLHPSLTAALTTGTGPLADLLQQVTTDTTNTPDRPTPTPPLPGRITHAYIDALRWSTRLMAETGQLPPSALRIVAAWTNVWSVGIRRQECVYSGPAGSGSGSGGVDAGGAGGAGGGGGGVCHAPLIRASNSARTRSSSLLMRSVNASSNQRSHSGDSPVFACAIGSPVIPITTRRCLFPTGLTRCRTRQVLIACCSPVVCPRPATAILRGLAFSETGILSSSTPLS
jgi:hypothetical protein